MSKIKDISKLQAELIDKLGDICEELGLVIGVPEAPEDGVLIGSESFVMSIVEALRGDYDVMGTTSDGKLVELLSEKGSRNEDPTFH